MTGSISSAATVATPDEAIDRLPVLDGLRGLAILLVLLYHFYGYAWIPLYLNSFGARKLFALADFGWSGVDLFFALSGFLITSILFRTKTSPDYFRSFYARRIIRIFPLYFLCVFALFHLHHFPRLQAWVGALPKEREWWFWTYLANWKIPVWRDIYLTHFWSLCVEEQFYLAWPLVVWLTNRRQFVCICTGLITLSLSAGLAMEFAGFPREFIQYATFPRVEAIVFGALGACIVQWKRQQDFANLLRWTLPLGFVAMLIVAMRPPYFRGFYVLEALSAGVGWSILLLFCLLHRKSVVTRFFQNRFLRMLGKYSYAMYCLNFLVFHYAGLYARRVVGMLFLSEATPSLVLLLFAVIVGSTVLAGFLSWHLLEKHLLRLRSYFPYRRAEAIVVRDRPASVFSAEAAQ